MKVLTVSDALQRVKDEGTATIAALIGKVVSAGPFEEKPGFNAGEVSNEQKVVLADSAGNKAYITNKNVKANFSDYVGKVVIVATPKKAPKHPPIKGKQSADKKYVNLYFNGYSEVWDALSREPLANVDRDEQFDFDLPASKASSNGNGQAVPAATSTAQAPEQQGRSVAEEFFEIYDQTLKGYFDRLAYAVERASALFSEEAVIERCASAALANSQPPSATIFIEQNKRRSFR